MELFSSIARVFPPPSFMTLPSMGVDISDTTVKYIQFVQHKKHLVIKEHGEIDLHEGIMSRGEIKDMDALRTALADLARKTGVEYVRVSLPEERAYLFETSVKHGTPYKDIRGLLEFRLEENVPLSPRDAYFDYDIVEDSSEDNLMRISVAVYAKDTVNTYLDTFQSAGFIPLSFEVESQAIVRAVISEQDDRSYMVVDFGKTRTGIGIVHRGILMYTSTIDIGGKELSAALRKKLGEVEESTLTDIKNKYGLFQTGDEHEVYDVLLPVMQSLRDELKAQISYWRGKSFDHLHTIDKIVLLGGSSNLAGCAEYFAEELGVEIERADVWKNAFDVNDYMPAITKRRSYGYVTAIGLGLKGFTAL